MNTWRVHLAGVKEILALRGGICTIDGNELLRVMLSWYVDEELSES